MKRTISLVFLLLLAHGVALAYGSTHEQESLRGVDSIRVVVNDIEDPRMRDIGVTEELLALAMELRLRRAGVLVHPDSGEVLYLTMNFKRIGTVGWAYSVSMDLVHVVTLARDPSLRTLAATWTFDAVGWFDSGSVPSAEEFLGNGLDAFESDYLAVHMDE